MSQENVERFFLLLVTDRDLQERMKLAINECEDPNPAWLAELAVQIGEKTGHSFTQSEVLSAMERWTKQWACHLEGELSDEELEQVSGGGEYASVSRQDPESRTFANDVHRLFGG